MDLQLSGKTAFISGSTKGIGYAIARALVSEGAAVIVNGRASDRVSKVVERLRHLYPDATVSGIAADFRDPEQVEDLLADLGRIDILVNNVGLFEVAAFDDVPDEDWHEFFDVNVMSGVRLSRHALPGMIENGWGRVIFISSESGVNVPADMIHYGATKAAMLAVSNGLSKLTRGTRVTVNSVLGGPTFSDGVAESVERIANARSIDAEVMKSAIMGGNSTTLLERFIDPDEIANLVLYLASPLSSATNGAALRADGGVLTTTL